MRQFTVIFRLNLRRRLKDGFAVGYNIIFPLLMIALMGFIGRNASFGGITGFQYYSVVMIPFSIILAVITAAYAGKDDAYAKTAERVLVSPVHPLAIVAAKILSELIVFTGCGLAVMLVTQLIWGPGFLTNIGMIVILYLSLSLFTAGIGTWIGLGMKNFIVLKNFISIPICIFAVLGNCFFRLGHLEAGFSLLQNISPFTWINRGIFMYIYDGNANLIATVSLIMAGIGILFGLLAVITFRREEYGNGELPAYEK